METNLSNIPKYTPEQIERIKLERRAQQIGLCRFECEHCQGLGYIRNGDGRIKLCPNVDRWNLAGAARYGITREEGQALTWSQVLPEPGIDQAISAIRQALDRGYGWVYLCGPFGVGKTLLLKIAVAESLRAGGDAAYVRMVEILDHLRAAFDEKTGASESTRLDWWSELPILAIDEIDRLRDTPYVSERRFLLLDRRYEDAIRQNSITIMASNADPEELPGYLYDRIRDGRFEIVRIDGQSLRPGMDWEHQQFAARPAIQRKINAQTGEQELLETGERFHGNGAGHESQ